MPFLDLTNSKEKAIVDDSDFVVANEYTWRISESGYVRSQIYNPDTQKGEWVSLHRFVLKLKKREGVIDHANMNRLDNRRANLRSCTISQNLYNCTVKSNNRSGLKGVGKNNRGGKYNARITVSGKVIVLGSFDSKVEAARAYDMAAIANHGEFARLNFPEEVA